MTQRFLLPALLTLLVGCSQQPNYSYVPVTGTVTLEGQPVVGAQVAFESLSGARAFGETDSEGAFRLTSDGDVPGAPQAEYVVRVVGTDETSFADSGEPASIPDAYQEFGVAIITVDDSGDSHFDLKLKKNPSPQDVVTEDFTGGA